MNLFTKACQFIATGAVAYKKYLIIGAILLASHGAVFGAGYLIAQRNDAQAQVQVEKRAGDEKVGAVIAQANQQRVERTERVVRDISRERKLQAQVDQLTGQRDTLLRTLYEKPDLDPDVHVRNGTVRMLNDAGDPAATGASGVPDPARLAAYQEQAPSEVSLRDLEADDLAIRLQYGELAARHDALVDWVEAELIAPMRDTANGVAKSQDKK